MNPRHLLLLSALAVAPLACTRGGEPAVADSGPAHDALSWVSDGDETTITSTDEGTYVVVWGPPGGEAEASALLTPESPSVTVSGEAVVYGVDAVLACVPLCNPCAGGLGDDCSPLPWPPPGRRPPV